MSDNVVTRPPRSTAEAAPGSQEAADAHDLGRFGYKQELRRVLNVYSSFAIAFSYISPSTGIFTLFVLGLAIGGPFFLWSWPIVALGQFIVALNFAEVSSHFPVAGSVYQWTKYLSNRAYSWMTGWTYLFAGVLTITAVDVTVPLVVIPLLNLLGFNVPNTTQAQVVVAAIILVSTTLLSIFGVRLVSLINNTGVVFEIIGMALFGFGLLIFFHHQPVSVVTNTTALGSGFTNQAGTFLAAMFMSLFVIYGFDTAGTLAEETRNPRAEAPKAILGAVVGAFVIGTIFLVAVVIALPGDIGKWVSDAAAGKYVSLADILTAILPKWAAIAYLLVAFAAIYVCCLAIQTSTIRLAFGMARDGKLPFGRLYNKVSATWHTPLGTCIVVGALAAIPLTYYAGAGTIAIAATGMIYTAYFLANIAVLIARSKGWPSEGAPFKLGGWGTIVNVVALLYGGAMLINFLWGRPGTAINPSVKELPGLSGIPLVGGVPIFEMTLGTVLVVGAIYYVIAQRGKQDQVVRAA
ncbi:MAG TPA: amino acid permease [Candidatus Dormibacteraeota bacterium]|nr:amino acid permease [Candidatus Dormibacteraeota bacterium]